ncbi:hypothetical protein D5687_09775 [Guyparkeria sp. SCN-R1]|uniref:hypothetical protein n=1 Tax=Guyparkeria sp. SCN-R1 TaxID=2341113 RepID=UPI000F650DB3|nr:hypothetical protein [Guyparkeria sp. SCN-R1]RRQ20336.1 hypothetical protein D5687_09775 [Guyparkeria sp. SCN-R1]
MKDAWLPTEVLTHWEEAFGPLSESTRNTILTFAPPVTPSALRRLTDWTGDEQWLRWQPLDPAYQNGISKMRYALFSTIEKLEELPNSEQARALATELLSGPSSEEADGQTYYRDCIAVRRMLLEWFSESSREHQHKASFQRWLEKKSSSEQETRNSNATKTLRLIQGERLAGVKRSSRNAPNYSAEHLSRITVAPKKDEAHENFYRPTPTIRKLDRSQNLVDSAYSSYRLTDAQGNDMQRSDHEEAADPDAPVTYQRRHSDLRTPRDDKRALSKRAWLEGLSISPTEFDIHRTPAPHVVSALATVYGRNEMVAWAYLWLIATTGLSPSRLRETKVDAGPAATLASDETGQIDIARGVLEYRLLDGPSGPDEASNRLVRLALPAPIIAVLQPRAVKLRQLDPESPFNEMESHINGILRRNHKTAGGLTATCQRIRAAAEAMIFGLALDTTAGLTLTGTYGHSYRGPAAYRVIDRSEIQLLFSKTTRRIASLGARHVSRYPKAPFPIAAETPRSGEDAALGSIKAVPVETIPDVFGHLALLAAEACERTEFEQGLTGVHLDTLIRIQNLSALHTYLGLLLGTGIRPVADRTVMSQYGTELWFVADKDSVDFVERRVVPALPIVKRQLEIHRKLSDEIRLALNRRLLPVRDREPQISALPLLFEHRPKEVIARRARQTDFMPIARQFGWDRRATRHTFATELREQVPTSELNALLGHAGGGWHRHGTSSMANQLFTPTTIEAIQQLLDRAGFGLLDLRGRYVT